MAGTHTQLHLTTTYNHDVPTAENKWNRLILNGGWQPAHTNCVTASPLPTTTASYSQPPLLIHCAH